jgi:hypothetical protein
VNSGALTPFSCEYSYGTGQILGCSSRNTLHSSSRAVICRPSSILAIQAVSASYGSLHADPEYSFDDYPPLNRDPCGNSVGEFRGRLDSSTRFSVLAKVACGESLLEVITPRRMRNPVTPGCCATTVKRCGPAVEDAVSANSSREGSKGALTAWASPTSYPLNFRKPLCPRPSTKPITW